MTLLVFGYRESESVELTSKEELEHCFILHGA
jgi:hypothetical protein